MNERWHNRLPRPIAFVLSGGANLGSIQIGMLKALQRASIYPDIVVGTSVGALNGAVIANYGMDEAIPRLEMIWRDLRREDIFPGGVFAQAVALLRSRLNLHHQDKLGELINQLLSVTRFEQLTIAFGRYGNRVNDPSTHAFCTG